MFLNTESADILDRVVFHTIQKKEFLIGQWKNSM